MVRRLMALLALRGPGESVCMDGASVGPRRSRGLIGINRAGSAPRAGGGENDARSSRGRRDVDAAHDEAARVCFRRAGDPFTKPGECTTMTTWPGGRASPVMHPGNACMDCHSQNGGPLFLFAGTIYPSAHDPDDCNGARTLDGKAVAKLVITGADGT